MSQSQDFPLRKWGWIVFLFVLFVLGSNMWLKKSIEDTEQTKIVSPDSEKELNKLNSESLSTKLPEFPQDHPTDENIAAEIQKKEPSDKEIIYEFPIQDKFLVQ